mgnify:CR=1 FL=1
MSDTLVTIIAIALAAILMFIFPLMTMSDRTDDVAQLTVDTATTEFVDDIRTTGKITPEKYNQFLETIGSTGNTYNVEMEAQILDENPGKKTTQTQREKIGENVYYSVYTSQIEEKLNNSESYKLKEGDIVSVDVKNTNQTLSQQLKNFFYKVVGNDTYTIAASHGGIVTATGK